MNGKKIEKLHGHYLKIDISQDFDLLQEDLWGCSISSGKEYAPIHEMKAWLSDIRSTDASVRLSISRKEPEDSIYWQSLPASVIAHGVHDLDPTVQLNWLKKAHSTVLPDYALEHLSKSSDIFIYGVLHERDDYKFWFAKNARNQARLESMRRGVAMAITGVKNAFTPSSWRAKSNHYTNDKTTAETQLKLKI
jgi:hypothetical protein